MAPRVAVAITLPAITLLIFLLTAAHAETIVTGRVIGVADGDTITVLQDKTRYRIRLYGIDCPESRQDFGTRATQFVSGLVFKKEVRVVQKEIDLYGRVVGIVHVGDICVNEALVRAGFAWVYPRYCRDVVCRYWISLEREARDSRIGLWSHPNPIPPWDFRRGIRQAPSAKDGQARTTEMAVYHGNTSSLVFHQPSCKHFECKNCTAVFRTREEAIGAGYRPCGGCRP